MIFSCKDSPLSTRAFLPQKDRNLLTLFLKIGYETHTSFFVSVCECVCLCMCLPEYVCLCMCPPVYVSACVCVSLYICPCLYACLYVCMFFVGPVRQNFHFPADFGQFLAGGSNLTPPSRLGLTSIPSSL